MNMICVGILFNLPYAVTKTIFSNSSQSTLNLLSKIPLFFSIINLLSQEPEYKKDAWVPFCIINFNEQRLARIVNKSFKKMCEREHFLIYSSSECYKHRENMFAKIVERRNE